MYYTLVCKLINNVVFCFYENFSDFSNELFLFIYCDDIAQQHKEYGLHVGLSKLIRTFYALVHTSFQFPFHV